jgi:acetyl-CoA carboxylase biotin carboxyl carrier protein
MTTVADRPAASATDRPVASATDIGRGGAAAHADGLLDAVRRTVVLLATDAGARPEVVRVTAGDVSVEVRFGSTRAAAGAGPSVAPPVPAPPPQPRATLTSPAVGVFYRAPQPGAAPFVATGDTVTEGQQIGIVEAMKLMIPIHAERAGRIAEALAGDGAPVEYGEPLFALDGG